MGNVLYSPTQSPQLSQIPQSTTPSTTQISPSEGNNSVDSSLTCNLIYLLMKEQEILGFVYSLEQALTIVDKIIIDNNMKNLKYSSKQFNWVQETYDDQILYKLFSKEMNNISSHEIIDTEIKIIKVSKLEEYQVNESFEEDCNDEDNEEDTEVNNEEETEVNNVEDNVEENNEVNEEGEIIDKVEDVVDVVNESKKND